MPGPGDICPHDIAVLERRPPMAHSVPRVRAKMCANPCCRVRMRSSTPSASGSTTANHAGKKSAGDQTQGGALPQARR